MDFIDEVFDELDSNTDSAIESLSSASKDVSKQILDEVNETIGLLKKDAAGNIVASIENIKKVNQLSLRLETYFSGAEYQQSVGVFLSSYTSNVKLINTYFSAVSESFTASDVLYKQLASAVKDQTVESLIGAGVSANVKDPIIKLLTDSVVTGSNRKEAYALLRTEILGDKTTLGRFERYTKQIGNDSITQFNSNYIQVISNDLGLKHYYYKGTNISDTREFCHMLSGKYLTEDDVIHIINIESAKNGGKGWKGMIKGTNWPNFKIYRGGWNCRHYLIPTSKAVYESKKDRHYNRMAA